MLNRTFLVLLRPIFCEKLKIAPPIRKQPPLKRLDFRIWPKNQSQFWSKPFFFFFFWRPPDFGPKKTFEFPISADKSVSITVKTFVLFLFFGDHPDFGPKKTFEFPISAVSVKTFFFFWRPLEFGRKNPLNFRAYREISSQFSDKPCETDSRTMKIRVKVVCTFLTLSK